jgi:hypothetical protein
MATVFHDKTRVGEFLRRVSEALSRKNIPDEKIENLARDLRTIAEPFYEYTRRVSESYARAAGVYRYMYKNVEAEQRLAEGIFDVVASGLPGGDDDDDDLRESVDGSQRFAKGTDEPGEIVDSTRPASPDAKPLFTRDGNYAPKSTEDAGPNWKYTRADMSFPQNLYHAVSLVSFLLEGIQIEEFTQEVRKTLTKGEKNVMKQRLDDALVDTTMKSKTDIHRVRL